MKKLGWWLLLTALFVVMASGAGAECKHENVENRKEYYYSPDYIYEYQFDEHYHISVWYKGVECQDCGEFVDIEVGRKEERHEWARMNDGVYCIDCKANKKNEVIICKYCGYDFLCWEGVYNGIPISATHHITMWESQFRCMRCEKTSAVWYGSLGYDSDYPEPHEFIENGDENGYCYWCGYYSAPDPLTVTLYPWDREVCVGEYIAVTAAVVGGSGEYSFQWYASSDTGLSVSGLEGITTKSACTWTFECTVTDQKTGETVVAKSAPIRVEEHEWLPEVTVKAWQAAESNLNHHYAATTHTTEVCSRCNAAGAEIIINNYGEDDAKIFGQHTFEMENREFVGVSLPFAKVPVCTECGYQQTQEDRYYNALLDCVENGRNPMEDEAFRAELRKRYNTTEMDNEKIEALFECLEDAPEMYRMVYLLSLGEYELVDAPGAIFNNESDLELRFNFAKEYSDEDFLDVFMHESGHGVECANRWPEYEWSQFGNWDLVSEICNAMENDVEGVIRDRLHKIVEYEGNRLNESEMEEIVQCFVTAEQVNEFNWIPDDFEGDAIMERYWRYVRKELCDELKELRDLQSVMASDVYGGMTNNKVWGEHGHDTATWGDYWYEKGKPTFRQFMEAYAEYFSAQITQNTYAINKNKEYFPTTVSLLDDYVTWCEEYYTDLLIERYGAIDAD